MVTGSYNRSALQHSIRAYVKGVLRRQAEQLLPSRETRRYQAWIRRRVEQRESLYRADPDPGLFSVLTAVWDGSPLKPLQTLANSLLRQEYPCEWVVLDNGCRKRRLVEYLHELSGRRGVKLVQLETNAGIVRGLRRCLENATGQYVLPVDADDLLYPDALRVVAACMTAANYPVLAYTDEDKVIGAQACQPYFKPDWDPVLLSNSAYIAHLGVMHRQTALDLGVYSDTRVEGSPDWDAFIRFLIAGYSGLHIPEIVYSWRVHAQSTADDAANKAYIHTSQTAVLQRLVSAFPAGPRFEVEHNELFSGAAHFRLLRCDPGGPQMVTEIIKDPLTNANSLSTVAREALRQGAFIHVKGENVHIEEAGWQREALTLFELHPDCVMIGGCLWDQRGTIQEAGSYFGFGGIDGCPYRGKPVSEPGYFGQLWKQRSVSSVSLQFAVVRAEFLLEVLEWIPEEASLGLLGAWAGAYALRNRKRIVYSPFLRGVSNMDWKTSVTAFERNLFQHLNGDLIPDRRFYSQHLSLERPFELEFGD